MFKIPVRAVCRACILLGCVVALACGAAGVARAEFPFAMRVTGGIGMGSAHHYSYTGGGFGGIASLDLAWRYRPGRERILFGDVAGPGVDVAIPEARFVNASHAAVLLGVGRSRGGPWTAAYLQGGVGVGAITPSVQTDGFGPVMDERTVFGMAVGAATGVRLIPNPGPVGIVLGLRASAVFASHSASVVVALFMFGFTIHPNPSAGRLAEEAVRP